MFRLLLLILVLAIGYDAVAHQGAYTRDAWNSVVRFTDASVNGARELGQRTRDEIRS